MLRKGKKSDSYELDRELTWKFAIEMNMELQKKVLEQEEEIKRLNNVINKLHADCYYYENHWMPKPWENNGSFTMDEDDVIVFKRWADGKFESNKSITTLC